ncbi:MAG: MGH1-like glycoside hydrolase domain-containing protein [Armatimonadota bacterium]
MTKSSQHERKRLFGEWLPTPVSGIALRLIVEQMSDLAQGISLAQATLVTEPPLTVDSCLVDHSITWQFPQVVEFRSLSLEQTSETEWIRRYRIEVSADGQRWQVAVPSRLIDGYHKQPCRMQNILEELDSSLLPAGQGTQWVQSMFEDYLLKTIEPLGPESVYPDWLSGEYFLAAAVRPFGFGGVYNSGDAGNFDALITAICSPEMAVEGQRLFPDLIHHFGFMPSVMNPGYKDDRAFGLDISGTTWGPCCYWDIFAWSRDRDYLRWYADACAKWARWWLDNRDRNGDGWIEPGINGCLPASEEFKKEGAAARPQLAALCPEFWDYTGVHDSTMSAFWHMICEIPWDDNPIYVRGRNRGLKMDMDTLSVNIHYIESQLYISLLCGYVAYSYRILGRDDEAEFFAVHALRLKALVRDHCWDEGTGFYHDRDIATGERRTYVKHLGAFVAMLMGLPTQEQARRMVEHLTNPREFWTEYPAPTISRDSPDYSPFGYWSGRAWPPTNFFVLRGLLNYGFFQVADEFLRRWLKQITTCAERPVQYIPFPEYPGQPPHDARYTRVPDVEWIIPENWHPESGAVYGSGGLTWGGLWLPAVIMRNFWPVGEHCALLRPGGHLRLKWGGRWDVIVKDRQAMVNGRSYFLEEDATYLYDERTGAIRPLPPGQAEPALLDGDGNPVL